MSKPFIPRYSRTPNHRWLARDFSCLGDRDKLGLLYVETCPHRHLEGIFILPPEYACADLGWNLKIWTSTLNILQTSGFIKWDAQSKLILIIAALLYQAPENDNQTDGAIRRILDLPESPLIQEFCGIALEHCNRKGASRAFKLFVEKLFKQTGTQLPEPTPTLLPQQGSTPLGEQGRSLNLSLNLKPPTLTKSLTISGQRPAGNTEKFRSEDASTGGGQPEDRMCVIDDPLKYLSPSLRETFLGHVKS